MKRLLSFIVVLIMMVTTLGIGAIAEMDTTVELNMIEGAAIRLNEKNGIRFYAQVDTEKVDYLREAGYTVELGTIIAPKDLLKNSDNTYQDLTFDLDSSKYVTVKFEATKYYEENTFSGIVGSIVNINEKSNSYSYDNGNKARPFVGRAYAIVTDESGNQTISYANYYNNDLNNNARSIYQLASAFKNDNYGGMTLTEEQLAKIEVWINCQFWTKPY